MPAQFDADLAGLKEQLLEMGATAEQMIRQLSDLLTENALSVLPGIYDNELKLDSLDEPVSDHEKSQRQCGRQRQVGARQLTEKQNSSVSF